MSYKWGTTIRTITTGRFLTYVTKLGLLKIAVIAIISSKQGYVSRQRFITLSEIIVYDEMFRHEFHVLSMLCCVCNYLGSFFFGSQFMPVCNLFVKKWLQWVQLTKKIASERKMPQQVATESFLTECKWDGHVQVGHFQKFLSDRSFIHWRFANKWSDHVVSHMAWSLHLISVMNYNWKRQKKYVQLLNTWIQVKQLFVKSIRRDL